MGPFATSKVGTKGSRTWGGAVTPTIGERWKRNIVTYSCGKFSSPCRKVTISQVGVVSPTWVSSKIRRSPFSDDGRTGTRRRSSISFFFLSTTTRLSTS